jgi:hypothetical protein
MIADGLLNEAIAGEGRIRAAREIMDRIEGRVPLPLVGANDEPFSIVIESERCRFFSEGHSQFDSCGLTASPDQCW